MQSPQHARPVRDIGADVSALERRMTALDGGTPIEQLGKIGAAIASLREAYQRNPRAFQPFLARLAAIRRRFETLLTNRMLEAVDRFHSVSREMNEAEREREFWRHYIVDQAGGEPAIRFEGRDSFVQIRTASARTLPPAGTDERAALEEALEDAGCLRAVSYISPVKLQSALSAGRIPTEVARVVEAVCPATRRCTVISRSRVEEHEDRGVA